MNTNETEIPDFDAALRELEHFHAYKKSALVTIKLLENMKDVQGAKSKRRELELREMKFYKGLPWAL